MKVNNRSQGAGRASDRSSGSRGLQTGGSGEGEVSFTTALTGSRERLRNMRIEVLIAEVDRWSARLKKSPNAQNLREYKERVRDFMARAVDEGLALDTQSSEQGNRQKIFVRVEKVNKELVKLTDQLLNDQSGTMEALDRIDEIRGLLLDLVG